MKALKDIVLPDSWEGIFRSRKIEMKCELLVLARWIMASNSANAIGAERAFLPPY